MRRGAAALCLCFWIALPVRAQASPLKGRVVHVADGDTITVLDPSNESFRVRLAGIDAPEKAQPWGKVSKQAMADLVAGHEVVVEWHKRDRYHRLVGVVRVDGEDAGLAQVAEGLAWHYIDYEKEQTPEDRVLYANAEQEARARQKGLWRDPDPVPPWVWRRRKRSKAGGPRLEAGVRLDPLQLSIETPCPLLAKADQLPELLLDGFVSPGE